MYLLVLALFTCLFLQAGAVEVELSQGWQRERLSWTLAGPHGRPNTLSELTYTHIDIYMSRLTAHLHKNDYVIKGSIGYGVVLKGFVQDADFFGSKRTLEFSRSWHSVTGDYTFDSQISCGKEFTFKNSLTLQPFFGGSYFTQKFRKRHGKSRLRSPINGKVMQESHVHGLNSTYRAEWYGPQLGLALMQPIGNTLSVRADYAFLFPLQYTGKGYWNLRERGSRHFSHRASAWRSYGHIVLGGVRWHFRSCWHLGLEYEWLYFRAAKGYQNRTSLHTAKRIASELRLSLGYHF